MPPWPIKPVTRYWPMVTSIGRDGTAVTRAMRAAARCGTSPSRREPPDDRCGRGRADQRHAEVERATEVDHGIDVAGDAEARGEHTVGAGGRDQLLPAHRTVARLEARDHGVLVQATDDERVAALVDEDPARRVVAGRPELDR